MTSKSAADAAVDVLIIGSGPVGAAYARTIADRLPDVSIMVAEAGPVVAQPPGEHVNNIRDPELRAVAQVASQGAHQYRYGISPSEEHLMAHTSPDSSLLAHPGLYLLAADPDAETNRQFPAAALSTNVGGMGSHWFGACPRPSEWERIGFIDRGTLDDALDAAERLLSVSSTQFLGSPVAAALEKTLGTLFDDGRPAGRRVQPLPLAAARTEHGVWQSGPAVVFGPLLSGAVPGFQLCPDLVCRQLLLNDGHAVGAELRSTRDGTTRTVSARYVVVAAGVRTPQLLHASGLRPPALGHYLNEHPFFSVQWELPAGAPTSSTALEDGASQVLPASGVTWIPCTGEDFPFHVQLSQRGRTVSAGVFLPTEPRFENRIEFSETEADSLGLPAMVFRYDLSGRDLHIVDRAREMITALGAALGADFTAEQIRLMPRGSSLHYQGTARMGPTDDGTSVCSPESRVWGTGNLFIGGNCVIPVGTAGNPTLTSVALGVLGAREIATELERAAAARCADSIHGSLPTPCLRTPAA